jgi:Secretion system C-terminal sorting domain
MVEYYVTANWIPFGVLVETSPTNTIKYERIKGNDIYKKGANPTIQFTYKLEQNYPNPFNPSTMIDYSIKNDGMVTIKIYDILGREVKTLIDEYKPAGNYKVNFDASSLTSGVYLYKLISGKFVDVKKMILLK